MHAACAVWQAGKESMSHKLQSDASDELKVALSNEKIGGRSSRQEKNGFRLSCLLLLLLLPIFPIFRRRLLLCVCVNDAVGLLPCSQALRARAALAARPPRGEDGGSCGVLRRALVRLLPFAWPSLCAFAAQAGSAVPSPARPCKCS